MTYLVSPKNAFGLEKIHGAAQVRSAETRANKNEKDEWWICIERWEVALKLDLVCSMKFQYISDLLAYQLFGSFKEFQVNKCAHVVIWFHGDLNSFIILIYIFVTVIY